MAVGIWEGQIQSFSISRSTRKWERKVWDLSRVFSFIFEILRGSCVGKTDPIRYDSGILIFIAFLSLAGPVWSLVHHQDFRRRVCLVFSYLWSFVSCFGNFWVCLVYSYQSISFSFHGVCLVCSWHIPDFGYRYWYRIYTPRAKRLGKWILKTETEEKHSKLTQLANIGEVAWLRDTFGTTTSPTQTRLRYATTRPCRPAPGPPFGR